MAIRKPTPKGEKSAAMAELLAQAGQESKFKNGRGIDIANQISYHICVGYQWD